VTVRPGHASSRSTAADFDPSDRRLGIIGPGRVGSTLAEAFRLAGCPVVAIFGRQPDAARAVALRVPGSIAAATAQQVADLSDTVFITVSDDAIDQVCARVRWRPDHAVVHCSGARELDALNAASNAGASVGSFHPLQMFATPAAALATLPGCTVAVEGTGTLGDWLDHAARHMHCRPIRLPAGHRALYHASAYYVGPFLIALMHEAAVIWRALGVDERGTIDALSTLLRGTVAAIMEGGLAAGMGGCVARGDVGTVIRHVEALDSFNPEMAALYRTLAIRTVPLGLRRGTLSADAAERIRTVLAT
jgi:predicted short-subunit dehydrogenase-like oxidoreductase (DUF2520 family)